ITADGGALWNDDEVEIFLQPPRLPTYRHLGMNAVGAITTESGAGMAWEANVAGVSRLYADRWVIELSIPFEDIGAAPRPGEAWGFNLAGHQVGPGQMWLTWSPTAGAFHDPAHFGKLVFE
ncbi:MAG TPA: sugar-binding protein, partial [Limnochordia bacterium]